VQPNAIDRSSLGFGGGIFFEKKGRRNEIHLFGELEYVGHHGTGR